MQKKEKYWVWLSNLKLKKITYIKLLEKYKDPEKIYNLEKLELHNNDFLQNEEIEKIVSLKNMKKIEYIEGALPFLKPSITNLSFWLLYTSMTAFSNSSAVISIVNFASLFSFEINVAFMNIYPPRL